MFQVASGGIDVGTALVDHPATAAVAFTGSLAAGRALFDRAAARPTPIPVFAEMGSINPVFVLPGAPRNRADDIASGLAQSVTLGVGQFWYEPGVTVGIDLDDFRLPRWRRASATFRRDDAVPGHRRALQPGSACSIGPTGSSCSPAAPGAGMPVCAVTTAVFDDHGELAAEVFGPSTLVAVSTRPRCCRSPTGWEEGPPPCTVTSTTPATSTSPAGSLTSWADRVGRIIWNGFSTGVAVTHAMQHGGPYPASTDSRSTSVGTAAMRRFLRPVSYQGAPAALLPEPLADENSIRSPAPDQR